MIRMGLRLVLACVITAQAVPLHAQTTTRISVLPGGLERSGDAVAMTPDARYFVLSLPADFTTGGAQVLVWRDRIADVNTFIVANSSSPTISDDGQFVAFTSLQPLAGGDINFSPDIYVWSHADGSFERVTVQSAPGGTQLGGSGG